MASFFRNLFSTEPTPPPFDLEREVAECLKALPPCAPRVVIASPKYSGNFRAEVTVAAQPLAEFVEHLNMATSGGTRASKVGRTAFLRWLRKAATAGTNTSYIPSNFEEVVSSYVLNFVGNGTATVYCPDCQSAVASVDRRTRNEEHTGPWSLSGLKTGVAQAGISCTRKTKKFTSFGGVKP